MKSRLFRRFLVVVSATAACTIVVVTMAMAIRAPRDTLRGPSTHGRYVLTVLPECSSRACTRATIIVVQLATGEGRRPQAGCPNGNFQLASARLRHGTFVASGEVSSGIHAFAVTVSGKFLSAGAVRGRVNGPRACGSRDSYVLSQ